MALHGSAEQENFDPSLVPVSSIVTLAKVAQKLVNGNGTLTNPGNLQIGATGTTPGGNLTVTGSILNGGLTIKGGTASPDSTVFSYGDGTGWRARFGKPGAPTLDVYDNAGGGVQVTGNLSATGNTTLGGTLTMNNNSKVTTGELQVNGKLTLPSGDINVKGTLELKDRQGGVSNQIFYNDGNVLGLYASTENKRTFYVDKAGNMGNTGNLQIDGNTTVNGNSQVNGNATVNGVLQLNGSQGQINDNTGFSRLLFHGPDKNTYYDAGAGNIHYFRGHKGAEVTNVNIRGNLGISTNLQVDGVATVNSHLYGGNGNADTKIRIGELWSRPGIYGPTTAQPLSLYSESKQVTVGYPFDGNYQNTLRTFGVAHDEADLTLIQNWRDTTCLVSTDNSSVTQGGCDRGNYQMLWIVKPNKIVHAASGKCLQHQGGNYTFVNLGICDRTNRNQSMAWDQANSAIFMRNPAAYDNSGYAAYLHSQGDGQHGNNKPYFWDSGCRSGGHSECTWVLR